MNKYEQLIEHIINNDEGKARALFHDIVVEKSRDIYESLMDDEAMEEDIHSENSVDTLVDEITMDETHIGEGDNEMEFDLDHEDPDGEVGGELGGDGNLEAKVMDLESELDALRAEFEQLTGDEEGMDDMDDMDDMGDEEDMDDMGDEEGMDDMDDMGDEEDEEDDEEEEDEMFESRNSRSYPKTAVDIMREYVEKISAPSNTEFTPVGTGAGGDKPAGNTKNPLAGKNDMGGSSQNIAKGGNESAPDGTSAPKKGNVKDVKDANNWENKPGAKAGNAFNSKPKAKTGEEGGVNKTSIESGGN